MTYAQAVTWCSDNARAINNARDKSSVEASILCRYFGRSMEGVDEYDYTESEIATAATDLQTILGPETYPTPS